MKKFSFIFALVLLACLSGLAQEKGYYYIKGQVLDQATGQPLSYASVVAQNTTIGVLTDSTGAFSIRLPEGGYTLSFSFAGYETGSMRVSRQSAEEELFITLKPESQQLDEVTIVLDLELKDGWERYGEFFLENFIGKSENALQCIIRNPEDLHFYFYKNRNTLKVVSSEPIMVENFALGYTLKFAIDSFTNNFDTRISTFAGYPFFEEMEGTSAQKKFWAKNRKATYYGSLLHFMRALYARQLEAEDFELNFFNPSGDKSAVEVSDIYQALHFNTDSLGVVSIQPEFPVMSIAYRREKPEANYIKIDPRANREFQISTLLFNSKEPLYVEENGYYYEQTEIITNGYLGYKKIADLLPFDYLPFSKD